MNLTALALDNKQFTLMAIFALVVSGLLAFKDISRAQDPGFKIRTAQVVTMLPGASPERVELLVTDKLEKAIREMPELDSVVSESKAGISIIQVNIRDSYSELRPVWDSLRRKIDAVQADLPDEALSSEVNDDFGDVFGIVVSLVAEGFSYAESYDVAEDVRDELLRLPLVAKVDIYGAQEERILIEFNNSRLADLGLSATHVAQFLSSKNIISSGGNITSRDEVIAVEPSGNIESLQALRETYIPIPGSKGVLPLGEIAAVYRDYVDPPRSLVHSSGKPALSLAISMREGGNIVELGNQVKVRLNDLQEAYPWGYTFELVAFQPYLVTETIRSFVSNLAQAVLVVSFTMLLSLGLRTGLIVATLIPVTILGSLAIMFWLDIGLNQVSLAALMIALGMLVDNSIVMAESTLARLKLGQTAYQAALKSADELKIPLLTSSLTTAAAFLPIYLAESTTGEYTAPIFMVVSIALLLSWFLAITMIPLLCTLFLKLKHPSLEDHKLANSTVLDHLEGHYASFLNVLLRNRGKTLGLVVLAFVLAMMGFKAVPNIFFPPSEDPTFKIEIELPMGTPIAKTRRVVIGIEKHLQSLKATQQRPGIVNWATFIGNGGPRYVLSHNAKSASPNYAFFMLNTSDGAVIDSLIVDIDEYLFEHYPDIVFSVKKLSTGAAINHPIEVRLSGGNKDYLLRLSQQLKSQLVSMPGVKGVGDDWGRQTKKFIVQVDEAKAQHLGITNSDVAQSLQSSLNGVQVAQYREGDKIIPIVLKSETIEQNGTLVPTSINVFSQNAQISVPLTQVTDVDLVWESASIRRRDGINTISVYADLDRGYTATQINDALIPWLTEQSALWPIDYRWELGGEAETSGKANQSISDKLPVAALIILLLLMGQFNSVKKTGIILLTIPLGVIGVVIGLLLANSYMGFMTLLGIISLAGIVINNAIVLIDRIQIEQTENQLPLELAIPAAAKGRMRPILLTTATTVLGMIPLWLGGGAMWEPMAISIIFGLLGATVLTLGIVPVLYAVFFNVPQEKISA
jgi:multidrug efflux pump